ncbi:MAG: MFS transporter, partial [Pirellulales bacterium]
MAAFLIRYVPPAAPGRPMIWNPWEPLRANLRILRRSRPLTLSVVGIAFFLFMTLFLRQTLIYEGEKEKEVAAAKAPANHVAAPASEDGLAPEEYLVADASKAQMAEFRIALLVALVGLGVGIGSLLAGHLSGNKLELGLVPIGGLFIAITAAAMAVTTHSVAATIVCLVIIGIAAGLYIVPLYTLLQHRAPKDSKGNMVATSNFLNVTCGGLSAVVIYSVLALFFETAVGDDPELQLKYVPRLLFLTAGGLTILMLFVLRWLLPDFFLRSLLWMRWFGRKPLEVVNVHHLPSDGLVLLATNGRGFSDAMRIVAACDRHTESLVVLTADDDLATDRLARWMAARAGNVVISPDALGPEEL